jgi:hypothetical protein
MSQSPSLTVVPLKTLKTQADEGLVAALMRLVQDAKEGKIQRMVCVCTGASSTQTINIKHRASDLAMLGALSVTLNGLQSEWNVIEPVPPAGAS